MAHLFGFLNSEMEQPQTTSRIHAPPIWSTKNVVGWLVLKRKQIVVWITTKVHSKLREVPIPTSDRSVHICGHLEKYLVFISFWKILLTFSQFKSIFYGYETQLKIIGLLN